MGVIVVESICLTGNMINVFDAKVMESESETVPGLHRFWCGFSTGNIPAVTKGMKNPLAGLDNKPPNRIIESYIYR
jgi:hypothetical protein